MKTTTGLEGQTDEELMLAYASGSVEAFDQIFARHGRKVYNLFLRTFGNQELARDLSQETWVRLIEARDRFRPVRSFSSWLYTIVMNLLRDELRRRRRRSDLEKLSVNSGQLAVVENFSVEKESEMADLKAQVQAAVQSLPEEQREVILLAKYQGLSYAEVAATLGISEAAAKQRAYRALQALRNKLGEL